MRPHFQNTLKTFRRLCSALRLLNPRAIFSFPKNKRFGDMTPAFSLMEVGFAVMITGILASAALPLYVTSLNQAKIAKTRDRIENAAFALGTYLSLKKRLPCPASPSALANKQGMEDYRLCNSVGILPYKHLGLSEEAVRDGYGRLLTYAVSAIFTQDSLDLTKPDPSTLRLVPQTLGTLLPKVVIPSYYMMEDPDPIRILDAHQVNMHTSTPSKPILVIISHGKMGGEFLLNGARRPLAAPNPLKLINANSDHIFVDAAPQASYDDRTWWVDRYTFIKKYCV